MSKMYNFSTKASIELASDGLIITSYVPKKILFKDVKHVYIKSPAFLSKGLINVCDEYIEVGKKDMEMVLDLEKKLTALGVVVARLRKQSSDTYIEDSVSFGGACSFMTFHDDGLVYHRFGETYKFSIEDISAISVYRKLLIFVGENGPFAESEDGRVMVTLRNADYETAVRFVENVKQRGEHIQVEIYK